MKRSMIRNLSKHGHHPRFVRAFLSSSSLFHSAASPASKLNEVEEEWRWKTEESEPAVLQVSHPWPEWVDLMQRLLKHGYFRADENPFRNADIGPKEANVIRTACLNFGRDQVDLIRVLSREEIEAIVALGCPSLDRKVINSGKRLRAYLGIDEGNVCSSCNLRGDCKRAFVNVREDEGGRTVDVMRILLTYGLDSIIASVENKRCITKQVTESVRRLLKEIVEHSTEVKTSDFPDTTEVVNEQVRPNLKGKKNVPMKQGDWLCPKCNFHNFTRNIRCLRCDCFCDEKIKQLKEDNSHLPLKKGDWICNKCNFLNFARNTSCLLCKEKPSNRQINPGEWECDSCNYINFRRNMICLKCDHRRPKMSNASSTPQQEHEVKTNHKNRKFSFVEDRHDRSAESPMVPERKNRNREWRFVEDGTENDECLNDSNDPFEILDFPIAGGKTNLSEPRRREEYKNESLKDSRRHLWQGETNDEFCSADNLSTDDEFCSADSTSTDDDFRSAHSASTDDEEMAEWFGNRKN